MIYQIRVKGEFDEGWCQWLGSILLSQENQEDGSVVSTLTVNAADQSSLFGILDRIRDLNIDLISVTKGGEEI
jgi:hypothetical protein